MTVSLKRETLHRAIERLPESTFAELARFIEFLQFKTRHNEAMTNALQPSENHERPPFNAVHFPEAIVSGVDFSSEYIAQARKELWAGFGGMRE